MKNYTVEKGKKWMIGDVTLTSIMETDVVYPADVVQKVFPTLSMSPDEWAGFIPDYATAELSLKLVTQSYLIQYKGKNILVDTAKNEPGPYEDNLLAAGCRPEDIDYVLFTHLHCDHVARNTKMSTNGTLAPTFPNARYLFGRVQYEHNKKLYENPEERAGDPLGDRQYWPYLLHMMPLVEMGKVDFYEDDFNLLDVIRVYPIPGHTVGQYAIVIESKGDSAYIGGDTIHNPIQMVHTDASTAYDLDPVMATKTREHLFGKLAGTDTLYLGMHLAGDHGGFVVKADKGYKLQNEYNN